MKTARPFATPFALLLLSGCASLLPDTLSPTTRAFDDVRKAPALPIVKNVTAFTDGLRCMDRQFPQYGVQMSVMVEEITDKTQKNPAGTTSMMLSSLSTMAASSQAIRTTVFGEDFKNIIKFAQLADSKGMFSAESMPAFTISGALSQFDETPVKQTSDWGFGFGWGKVGGAGGQGKSTSISEMALDLHIVRSRGLLLVAGASSANKASLLQDGSGRDFDMTLMKFGVNFQTSLSKADGKAVALRNLVDLGTIELVGRVARVPYWRCLNIEDDHADVQREIKDWFEGMSVTEKVGFFVRQFRAMGLFLSNAAIKPEDFKLAVDAYARALGMAGSDSISLELFQAHFRADQVRVAPKTSELFQAARQTAQTKHCRSGRCDRG